MTIATLDYLSSGYDITLMAKDLDQINIMSYGMSDDIPAITQRFHAAGFPYKKMIGGVETEYDYGGGVDTPGAGGSIMQKCGDVKREGLAGLMAWRMDNDYDYCVINACPPSVPHYPTYAGAIQLGECQGGQ